MQTECSLVELRQYTLVPGTRAAFVNLFEREFVDSQESLGMRLLGTFIDLDAADRFVWLRGFADLAQRHAALTAFYGGECWRANREQANGMMVDSDDVRLLRPIPGLPMIGAGCTGRQTCETDGARQAITIAIQPVRSRVSADDAIHSTHHVDASVVAVLETADVVNTFPQLPVIEDESAVVVVLAGADRAIDEVQRAVTSVLRATGGDCDQPATVLRVAPTPRSKLVEAGRVHPRTASRQPRPLRRQRTCS